VSREQGRNQHPSVIPEWSQYETDCDVLWCPEPAVGEVDGSWFCHDHLADVLDGMRDGDG
jgi:hypothetical protein